MNGVARTGLRTTFTQQRRRVTVGICLLATVSLGGLALPGGSSPAWARGEGHVPKGMIAYDKPVYKNGRRVLYHGPKQGKASVGASKSSRFQPKAVAAAAARDFSPTRARLTIAIDPHFGTELAAALKPQGVDLVVAAQGPTDLFLMPMPIGDVATPGNGRLAIARLFDCEIAVVGAGASRTIADLAGKLVAAPPASTPIGRVTRRLFAAAGLSVTFVDAAPGAGPRALRLRAADAYVAMSAALDLSDAPTGARLLSIPYTGALRDQFLPAEFAKVAFPALIDAAAIDTVAQPVLLATQDPGGDRAKTAALARFTEAFFSALAAGSMPDAKWRDVNPAARLPISRFEAAQAWIEKPRAQ